MWTLAPYRTAYKKESDREKIDYIYSEYRYLLLSKAYSILKDRGQAEDALHDSFLHIWENIGKIDDPRSSQAIVLAVTIVRNRSYALLGMSRRNEDLLKKDKSFDARGIKEALNVMPAKSITKAVNKLGGENKNIFLLKYAYGFSCRKIAKTLDDSESNISVRLLKAQKRLRALLLRGGF